MDSCEHKETEPHPCPFMENVNGDATTLCTCCADCENQCEQDV